MAVTKILARKGRLDVGIRYVLNGDKTDDRILTATINCDPNTAVQNMIATKARYGKTDGVQYYHMIQSFKPGEITPELALEIAKEFAEEYLSGYEVVIGTHVDKGHIHSHLIFNSVSADTGEKYHSNAKSYYSQIRAISDRICKAHGLSVILEGQPTKAVSYVEWLREKRGQPTFRSMLEEDLRQCIEDANDIGHFFLLMEHRGYEIKHGNRLGFRFLGQERYMYPQRKDSRYSEDGIRAAIAGNLLDIEQGIKPPVVYRPQYRPYRKHPKYKGFMALYVHYLYILGKIEKHQYPPRMTPKLRKEVMRFEQYRRQFQFMQEHHLETRDDLEAFMTDAEAHIKILGKQRTILNVRKKKRQSLFSALADENTYAPAARLYEEGLLGMEAEFARYMEAVQMLEECNLSREELLSEKAELYTLLADLNREIRQKKQEIRLCQEILEEVPNMQRDIEHVEAQEVKRNEYQPRR